MAQLTACWDGIEAAAVKNRGTEAKVISFVRKTEGACSVTSKGAMLTQAAGDYLKAIPDLHETLILLLSLVELVYTKSYNTTMDQTGRKGGVKSGGPDTHRA